MAIIPAILVRSSDEYRLKIFQIENFVNSVHIDFMDGRFVPNISVGIKDIGGIPTKLEKTAHLMMFDSENNFSDLAAFAFKQVIIHYEAYQSLAKIIAAISQAKKLNLKIGLSLNPETLETVLSDFISLIDEVSVMTVKPGFGGQNYQKEMVGKVARIKRLYPEILIAVDGGINEENIKEFYQAGARQFVMGSSIFDGNPRFAIEKYNHILEEDEKNQTSH